MKTKIKIPRWFGIVISSIIVLILLTGAANQIDLRIFKESFSKFTLLALLVGVFIMWFNFLIATQRFNLVLKTRVDAGVPFFELLKINFLSFFAAHLLPIGPSADVARFGYARWKLKISSNTAMQVILMDRLLGVLGLAVFGIMFLPIQYFLGTTNSIIGSQLILWMLALFGILLIQLGGEKLLKFKSFQSSEWIKNFLDMAPFLFKSSRLSGLQLLLAFGHCFTFSILLWWLAYWVNPASNPWVYISFGPTILIFQSIPLFYAGWGGREATAVATIASVSVIESTEVLTVSIAAGMVFFLASIPGALVFNLSNFENDLSAK